MHINILTYDALLHDLSTQRGAVEAAARMERVLLLDETDSTNRVLLQMAADGAPGGQVVIADAQTAVADVWAEALRLRPGWDCICPICSGSVPFPLPMTLPRRRLPGQFLCRICCG